MYLLPILYYTGLIIELLALTIAYKYEFQKPHHPTTNSVFLNMGEGGDDSNCEFIQGRPKQVQINAS